jgi:hypothetical protein
MALHFRVWPEADFGLASNICGSHDRPSHISASEM